jgi:hypothetical protein
VSPNRFKIPKSDAKVLATAPMSCIDTTYDMLSETTKPAKLHESVRSRNANVSLNHTDIHDLTTAINSHSKQYEPYAKLAITSARNSV